MTWLNNGTDDDEPDWVVEHAVKVATAKRQKHVDKLQEHESRLKRVRDDVHQRKRRKVKPKVKASTSVEPCVCHLNSQTPKV